MTAAIEKIGVYLPENILTNDQLKAEFPDWNIEKYEKKIGIRERRVAAKNETALDLGLKAAENVLKDYDKSSIDALLFCTQSPDYFLPTSACILQEKLGLQTNTAAFDFNLGCSGFVYGLAIAKGLIAGNLARKVLLITAETYSKYIYQLDRSNRLIFGDAGAATIIGPSKQTSIGEFVLGTDGGGAENLIVKNGAARNPVVEDPKETEQLSGSICTPNNLYMNGPEIFNFTIDRIPPIVRDTLQKNNVTIKDIKWVVFHQANKYMLRSLRDRIDIPKEKFYIDMLTVGNTVSATIPIALKDCFESKKIKKGDKIMLVGFGVGYSWASTVFQAV